MEKTPVAPFTGAWIEMIGQSFPFYRRTVAPFTGAWIEMVENERLIVGYESLPLRERGLKSVSVFHDCLPFIVAPFTGAWIEITKNSTR